MTTYAVGSDRINGKETTYINQAIERIQNAGNDAHSVGVSPGVVQRYGQKQESQDQVGVMIVGGRGLGTPVDFHTGVTKGYYHYSHVYVIGSSEFTGNTRIGSDSMDTPVTSCERQMTAKQCSQYIGLTPRQFNQKFTNCTVVYCDNFSDGLATVVGGDTGEDSSDSTTTDTGTSYKDMIQDLIKVYDGLIEVRIDGNVMNIRRVPDPEPAEPLTDIHVDYNSDTGETKAYKKVIADHNIMRTPIIWASEGVNITNDGLSMTDYNPNTVNTLYVTYNDDNGVSHKIAFTDDILWDRFGEKSTTMEAVQYLHPTVDKTDPDASDSSSDSTDATTSTSTTTTSADSGTEQVTIEVPVTTYEDALSFGLGQWYKLQRDNGHTIECKVIGSNLWRVGRWCKVYLPVYSEYCDMYVNRANHSLENGAWTTSLELTPAPACIKADDSTTEETQTPSTDSNTNSSTDSNTDTEDTDTTNS